MEDKFLETKILNMIDGLADELIKHDYEQLEEGNKKDILTDIFSLNEKITKVLDEPLTECENIKDKMSYIATVALAISKLDRRLHEYSREYMKSEFDKKSLGGGYSSWTNLMVKL